MMLLMLPFIADNVAYGLFAVPNLAFTLVPACFIVLYAGYGAWQLWSARQVRNERLTGVGAR